MTRTMFKSTAVGLILFGIPEMLLVIWAVYTFSGKEINKRDYLLSAFLYLIITVISRYMPVLFGIHTIINIIFLIIISVKIIKLPVNKAISCGLIAISLRAFTELLNILALVNIYNIDLEKTFKNELIKNLYGMPSVFLYGAIILFISIGRKREV